MTARKAPAAAIGVDEALYSDLASRKDAILDELQAARQQRTNREARYDRDRKRLDAEYDADLRANGDTVNRLERAMAGINAAQEAMCSGNVVKLRAAE